MKKIINIGKVKLGAGNIVIQSMTNTITKDIESTVAQVKELANAGAELVRVSVPDKESAFALKEIVNLTPVPIIADIHYSSEPAIIAIENGVSKIRINPYNMNKKELSAVVKKSAEFSVPIRVGVNKGSAKDLKTPRELAVSALDCAHLIEDMGWDKIVLAVKSSDVRETVEAYRTLNEITDYPLHIGLTEAGTEKYGLVKSAIAIGSLLLEGIGDTIRVSLTANPVKEVYAAKQILQAVGLDKNFVEVVACPTCARTQIDVVGLAEKIEKITENYTIPIKIAVMGCTVNGIGESKGADFGVAGGKYRSVIFKNGEKLKTVNNSEIENALIELIAEKING